MPNPGLQVLGGFFWGGCRRGSFVFQVSHVLMCLIGLAGWPGSRWTNGSYSESHGQGLSSCLVWTLGNQRPPSSDKKVRCGLEQGIAGLVWLWYLLVPEVPCFGCEIPKESLNNQRPRWGIKALERQKPKKLLRLQWETGNLEHWDLERVKGWFAKASFSRSHI